MIGQAFSLGLSAGLFCVGRCVPTLTPLLLLSPHKGLKNGLGLVGLFLSGRLVTYGALGLMAGFVGSFGNTLPFATMANTARTVLEDILSISDNNYTQAQNIATAAEEQAHSTDEISKSIELINMTSQETASAMVEASQAVAELAKLSEELEHLVENMKTE